MSKILISGATGFIGSHLMAELIEKNIQCDVIIHKKRSVPTPPEDAKEKLINYLIIDDLVDLLNSKKEFSYTTVVHLATYYLRTHESKDVKNMLEANIILGGYMLEIAKMSSAHFIFTSSYLQYENDPLAANSLYISTKRAFADLASYYERTLGLPIAEAVIFDTYGSNDSRGKLLNTMLGSKDQENPLRIANPLAPISLTHVDDVVKGLISLIENHETGKFRLAQDEQITVKELARLVRKIENVWISYEYPDIQMEPKRLQAFDFPVPLGWEAKTDLAYGIKRLAESIK
jgi:nucleoside-diphosphate-sugar epimerase